jgi:RNA polymerase sigma factor (sigma-70 family)
LLRRFAGGDEAAFAELVRRHGRLVWSVCRHLTGSDAEADDAFQATFLVLLRGAGKVRDAGRLSAWLHGVAYRVCARARRAARRRATREQAAAVNERTGPAVADSAWDRALAAVHEELGTLPDTLRVPFVLCCLEGKGVTEAAEQLGWKLGTLSGRLTRAKDALLARLNARGLTLGAVAGLGLAAPPAAAAARAAGLARAGSVIPDSILQLTQGVIGMGATTFKALAAAALLACGLGVVAGAGWMANADAQQPGTAKAAKSDPETELRRLKEQLDAARLEADAARRAAEAQLAEAKQRDLAVLEALTQDNLKGKDAASARTAKWEYDFVLISDMTQAKFVAFLQDRENRGWDFAGTTPLTHEGKPAPTWVFRRPVKPATMSDASEGYLNAYRRALRAGDPLEKADGEKALEAFKNRMNPDRRSIRPDKPEDAKAIEAEIARLQERLAALKGRPSVERVSFTKADLPLDPMELADLLRKLATKKFKNANITFTASEGGLVVEGHREVTEWATALIRKLAEK